jgi:RNA polymerase sigma-70 factor, ECF subfamily
MPGAPPSDELRLVAAIKRGDEDAFVDLVTRYNASMVRLARLFVPTKAVAEDVVQETWLAVIQGIDRFEGRSSLKTWLFRILTNRAKTRGEREGRQVPFSSSRRLQAADHEPVVDPDRFIGPSGGGAWTSLPAELPARPDDLLLSKEFRRVVDAAVRKLPQSQREVITLRDVEELPSNDVCSLLGITEGNQRVLLHRARSRVRTTVERYLEEER